jgi:hypothetical protein
MTMAVAMTMSLLFGIDIKFFRDLSIFKFLTRDEFIIGPLPLIDDISVSLAHNFNSLSVAFKVSEVANVAESISPEPSGIACGIAIDKVSFEDVGTMCT